MEDEFVKVIATCPTCGSKPCEEQPQLSLHCFTTVYECGYAVDAAISPPECGRVQIKCMLLPEQDKQP